jgi:hypothetical protein
VLERFLGIDLGAETLKIAELTRSGEQLRWTRRLLVEHHKAPGPRLTALLRGLDWASVRGAAATGRLARLVRLTSVPTKQAQAAGYRFLRGKGPATLVSIGTRGFSVLELRESGVEVFRENSRCSQGSNFLRQLVERFGRFLVFHDNSTHDPRLIRVGVGGVIVVVALPDGR